MAQVPQDPGSKAIPLSKVERMNKAPVSDEILRVKIPRPTEIHLANGLTVLVLEDHRLPLVTARLTILGAGALNDPADVPGLADITATMLKEGTRRARASRSRSRPRSWGPPSERKRRLDRRPRRLPHRG